MELARAVVHEAVESEQAEKYGEASRVPALPPGRDHSERKLCGETESAAGGAAGDGESVIAGGKSGITSFAASSFVELGFEAGEAVGAADIFRVAIGQRGEIDQEIIVTTRGLGMALAKTIT